MTLKDKKYFSAANHKDCILRAEQEDGGKKIIKGLAIRFDSPTVLFTDAQGNEYKEIIARSAFDGCVMDDTVLDRGHDMEGKLLGRVKSGTLKLNITEEGLSFECEPPDTELGNETYELTKRGDLYGCSFAAYVAEDSFNRDTLTRTILKFKELVDVAVVTFPAYTDTVVNAEMRSAYKKAFSPSETELLEAEKKKMLLNL